jgi:hypothetical protein
MGSVAIILTRAALIDGGHVEAGQRLRVAPAAAAGLLDAGRCQLVHAGDAGAVERARVADRDQALRLAGRGPR